MTGRPSNSEHVPHAHVCCHPKEVYVLGALHHTAVFVGFGAPKTVCTFMAFFSTSTYMY